MNTRRIAGRIVAVSFFSLTLLCVAQAVETDSPSPKNHPLVQTGLEVGNRAPLFSGKGLANETIDLKTEAAGAQYVLVDFWASWCGSCRTEFPHLRRLQERYAGRGLKIIGITSDTDRDAALQAAKGAKLDYPHIFSADGGKALTDLYKIAAFPQTYLLDSNLNIIAKGLRGASMERRMEQLFVAAEIAGLKPYDTVVVTAESAQLKVRSDVLAKLPKGQKLSFLKKQGNWVWTSVNHNGKNIKGWVYGSRIAIDKDSPSAKTGAVPAKQGHTARRG